MTDWLQSALVSMAENCRPVYNAHPRLLHAHLVEKERIMIEERELRRLSIVTRT